MDVGVTVVAVVAGTTDVAAVVGVTVAGDASVPAGSVESATVDWVSRGASVVGVVADQVLSTGGGVRDKHDKPPHAQAALTHAPGAPMPCPMENTRT